MFGSGVLLADRYHLDEQLGRGGMGEVWRATDQVLGRTVAVKVMRPELVTQAGFAQRFLAEARSMATIKHPAVVDIYDYQGDSSGAFLVMELVEGESLSERIRRLGRIEPGSTMALMAQAADALQAAHDKGIVHRDIKPANFLVTGDDRVVLTDFGIARTDQSAHLTATGQVIGTPSYLAPEQVLGRPATPRSDIYALGVVAYECLTGRLPFSGENSFALATQRLSAPPAPIDADVPRDVAAVVQRALAAEPEQRWGSARQFAEAARAPHRAGVVAENATTATIATPDAVPTQHVYPATAPTMRVPPAPPTVRRQPPTKVQPAATRPATPPTPAARREPEKPRKHRRPRSLIVGALLMVLAAAGLAVYVSVLASIQGDVASVVENQVDIDIEIVLNAIPVAALIVTALYGFLALMLLLVALPLGLGSRVARRWAYSFGFVTLLVAAPLGLVAAILFTRMEPDSEFQRALLDVVPSSGTQNVIIAGIVTMIALVVAMILLATRPVKDYIANRGR